MSACGGGDSTAPAPTTIKFNVTTTGVDLDADGFTLAYDGQSLSLPANGTLSVDAVPGQHTLAVSGLAFNCDLVSPPTSVNAVRGATTQVDIQASCAPYLRNIILYISEEHGDAVMAMRPDGSRRIQLSDNGIYAGPAVSPDGQTVAVSYQSDGIYLFDRFWQGGKQLVAGPNFDGSPAWSPDGKKIAFRRQTHTLYGDENRIFIVNRDGSGLRQLTPETTTSDAGFEDSPSWTPDGTRILFQRNGDLLFINADGTGLVSTGVRGESPSLSRDGTHIAYESLNGGNQGIWTMDMSFTPHQLTTPVQSDQMARWSPDGGQLVFERAENGVGQLYKMNADGSGVTKLSTSVKSDVWPSWSPNF